MQFHIENMTCGGCARSVTKAIHTVDPEANVDVDQNKRNVVVPTSTSTTSIASALERAGFPAVALT